jgi:hypothetical protein
MQLDQLKPTSLPRCDLSGASASHCRLPMGNSVKLIGKALNTAKVHEPILRFRCFGNSRNVKVPSGTRINSFCPGECHQHVFPLLVSASPCHLDRFLPFTPYANTQKTLVRSRHTDKLLSVSSFILLPLSFLGARPGWFVAFSPLLD